MAFWGLEVKAKKPLPLSIERRLVIKQAALVIDKPSAEPCVLSVSVAGGAQQYVVCRLHEGRLEHCTLELPFSPSDNAVLHLKGPHTLHLTGFLDMDEEDDWDEMDEEAAAKKAARIAAGADDEDEDDDDEDDDDFDEEGEEDDDEFDDMDDDDDDDDEEDDDDDDEDEEEEEVVLPTGSKKRAAPAPPPPAKKAKAAAPAPAPAAKPPAKPAKAAPPAAKPAAAAKSDATPGINPWTKEEEAKFKKALAEHKEGTQDRWTKVAALVGTRTKQQCKKKFQVDGK